MDNSKEIVSSLTFGDFADLFANIYSDENHSYDTLKPEIKGFMEKAIASYEEKGKTEDGTPLYIYIGGYVKGAVTDYKSQNLQEA
jgi:hypothetical protein